MPTHPNRPRFAPLPALGAFPLLLALLAGCPTADPNAPKPCQRLADCETGQACREGVCTDLPCGGRCDEDQACVNEQCRELDGLTCAADPSVCGTAFGCNAAGTCAKKCTQDSECQNPALPRCNVDTFLCGECSGNPDCADKAGRPFCDPRSAKCVGCLDNRSCDVGGAPTGKYCDEADQTCKDGCNANGDCPAGKSCKDGNANTPGRCIECQPDPGDALTGDFDCQPRNPRLHCKPETNLCVNCLKKDHCQVGEQCNPTTNVCVQCLKNEDCAFGNVCNLETQLCVPGCVGGLGGDNCPDLLPACLTTPTTEHPRGQCVQCLSAADCPANGTICKNNACVPGCVVNGLPSDARCPDDTPYCRIVSGKPDGACLECISDQDCTNPDEVCDRPDDNGKGFCRCRKAGESCDETSDCGFTGWEADGRTPKCVKPGDAGFSTTYKTYCITRIQCGSGSRNIAGVCSVRSTVNPGESCSCSGAVANGCTSSFSGITREATSIEGDGPSRQCLPSNVATCP